MIALPLLCILCVPTKYMLMFKRILGEVFYCIFGDGVHGALRTDSSLTEPEKN